MALTDLKIRRTAPQLRDLWLSDEKGLRLLVKANGSKYWRLNYRYAGKQKTLACGVYPDVSLRGARERRNEARKLVSQGIDPSQVKKDLKRQNTLDDNSLFSVLAKSWWEHQKGTWTDDHANRVWTRLEANSFEFMDRKPMDKIRPQDVLEVVRDIEKRDALDVASRVLQDIRRVFRFGVQEGRVILNPASELSGVVKARKSERRASMKNHELGQFMVELSGYGSRGRLLTQYAVQLLMLTFLRPGELRGACWREFDLAGGLWRIPEERMKMKVEHLVPLSAQVVALLGRIKAISGEFDLLFPSERNRRKPMSDNTMRRAMFKLGYDGETENKSKATPHGFRANASSILNEKGFNRDAIERQLSHMERNNVRAAYIHHAEFLDERVSMMQWWADHLDERCRKELVNR